MTTQTSAFVLRAFILIATFTSASLFISDARADEPVSNYEHLKHLDRWVGSWNATGKFLDGTEYKAVHTWRWGLNKNFLLGTFRRDVDGMPKVIAKTMIGWDVADQKVKGWEFWDDSRGDFAFPSESEVTGSGYFHDGTEYSFVGKLEWPDNDTQEYHCDLKKGDGSEGVWKITLTRRKDEK